MAEELAGVHLDWIVFFSHEHCDPIVIDPQNPPPNDWEVYQLSDATITQLHDLQIMWAYHKYLTQGCLVLIKSEDMMQLTLTFGGFVSYGSAPQ